MKYNVLQGFMKLRNLGRRKSVAVLFRMNLGIEKNLIAAKEDKD